MVAEVNRLIANLFAAGESIAFPQVGTLLPTKRPARRLSKKQLIPPTREIDFASDLQGATLAERLAAAAHCSLEQAEEIYGRWLAQTYREEVLTLEGIGVLQHKHFKIDPAFDARLNPQGRKPIAVRVRRRGFDLTMLIGVVAILAAVTIGIYGYKELKGTVKMPWQKEQVVAQQGVTANSSETTATTLPVESMENTDAPAQPATSNEEVADEPKQPEMKVETAPSATAAVRKTAPTQTTSATNEVEIMRSGQSYVVLGVFSTVENAQRAANEAFVKHAMRCSIYRFGQKWMVSPFTSADPDAATQFRRTHLETHPDLWVYKAR